jgi:GAF domain-containing protein
MKRRSKSGHETSKSRPPTAAAAKPRNAPKAVRNRGASIAGQGTAVDRLTHERDEALLRETANVEILRLISKSSGDLETVFRTILEHATRICNANFGTLFRVDGENIIPVAQFNTPTALLKAQTQRGPFKPTPGTAMEHVLRTKQVSGSADKATEPVPGFFAEHGGARSQVAVPMLKDDLLIGVIVIYHQEVRPFTDKQIELLQNFASQAVIAIENARLLNELRQRTEDLSESLEQQTATSEVLKVIAGSQGKLELVFTAMLENATRICGAKFGVLYLCEGQDTVRAVAMHGAPQPYLEERRRNPVIRPAPATTLGRVLGNKQTVQNADVRNDARYLDLPSGYSDSLLGKLAGARTILAVPMLKNEVLIGAFGIYRQEVRPFTDKQIALVQNFASQAVIAIENGRLLSELRDSLGRQTATSEVLRVISSSRGDLTPVFHAILENATRICEATFGSLLLCEGEAYQRAALYNAPPQFEEFNKNAPILRRGMAPTVDHAIDTRQVRHTLDAAVEEPDAPIARYAGARTLLDVPMLKADEAIGIIGIYRQEVRSFSDTQIELVKNFAAQAVIAIENARLLSELRESLDQQTATADVLRIISSSPGELEPVFQAMLENATRLCEAKFGMMYRFDGDAFHFAAEVDSPRDYVEFNKQRGAFRPVPGGQLERVMLTKEVCHTPDDAAMIVPGFAAKLAGARTQVIVPMLKDSNLIGAIVIYRQEVRPFTEKQIELVKNFAAQAVIAIENARLLNELRERTEEVVKLNQQLEARVADQVGEIERMGRLRRFLPPQVADLIVASGTEKQLESHRREITALFCDLRGFTGFSESSDPEDVMTLLRQYHAAIGEIIIKYSGTLERYAGDGVMVVFNDPVPVDNPALQAVRMALEMRAALGALIEKWRRLGHELGFGIGIAHGYATLGTIGFEGRFDYAAIGTVSNVASRLCDEAKPGEILISPRVLMAVEDAISAEPAGDFALKGISRPLTAYNVVGAK